MSVETAVSTGVTDSTGAATWKQAYADLYRDGAADFPPACLHYLLELVRTATRAREPGENTLSPTEIIRLFRQSTLADFGPLAREVLEDWDLRNPADLGRALALLERCGCLKLDPEDTLENFALDAEPLARKPLARSTEGRA